MRFLSYLQRFVLLVGALSLLACSHPTDKDEALRVHNTFEVFKSSLFASHAKQALSYLDRTTLNFLYAAIMEIPPPDEPDAQIKKLIRLSVTKVTPGGITPDFTPDIPLQRILNEGWMNTHDLDSIEIGPVTVNGDQAYGEILWEGKNTSYKLLFIRESDSWKVDLMSVIPYAGLALRMDRMMKNETEDQQVDRLVKLVPVP